ncbi:delta-class carbonic anhydrase [Puniceibacterium sediminis]|uniref:Cadmium carbonic anhydrase repeat-containing protein n=1 Tax=Puniceibacterium sediminis TaxID=1608407 RepID=A0A238YK89_9RHOB|nr:delta-class carbonic anhydrase [Puniceibacterium sediminis]SNR70829.1 Cadmium carbonic anhydrase repeat-containing protein [Puniceibacterium sediminis]
MNRHALALSLFATTFCAAAPSYAEDLCLGFGPQTPRDIGMHIGSNPRSFSPAPGPEAMNLCNLHTHTNAEHKGPGFSLSAGDGENGGFQCNETATLSPSDLAEPETGHTSFHGVKPGDTIEVHWVYTSCDVSPGPGLGSCSSAACANPQLRVESQVFLVVNDPGALDFGDYAKVTVGANGRFQPAALPSDTGTPVLFAGSTTGPSYTEAICSPMQVTWNVRPTCARLDISSLNRWAAEGNVFEEEHSHGVRQLVTAPELLSPIN